MQIKVIDECLNGVKIFRPEVYQDDRGFFMEAYRIDQFSKFGMDTLFVQDNHSRSCNRVLRGLHFQWSPPMGKLMRVTRGSAFLVAVDIRVNSPTLGKWHGIIASEENMTQVWAPAGFARGFCGLADIVEVQYKCTGVYNSQCESGIQWDDPEIGIEWPVKDPIISNRDQNSQSLREWLNTKESANFTYE